MEIKAHFWSTIFFMCLTRMRREAIIMDETKELLDLDNYLSFDDITSKGIITKSNCITGNTDHFVNYLREAFKKAKSIDIIVAFLMESGVRLLEEDLKLIKEKKHSHKNTYRELFKYNSATGTLSIKGYIW